MRLRRRASGSHPSGMGVARRAASLGVALLLAATLGAWTAAAPHPASAADPCAPGTFSVIGDDSGGPCTPASPGYFVDLAGAMAQSACPAGKYQPASGAVSCLITDPGHFAASTGTVMQVPCGLGYYQPNAGATSCIEADPGYYAAGTGTANQAACSPGWYQPSAGGTTCFAAPAGHFVSAVAATSATPCADGTYQPWTSMTLCVLAEPGHFVDSVGATSTTLCAVGTIQPNAGATSCLAAPVGTYVDVLGAVAPIPCPVGTTTAASGSTSAADCVVLLPRGLKERAIATLTDLLPSLTGTAHKRMADAIARLQKSLTPAWWVDDDTLAAKHGSKVFDEEKQAVRLLTMKEVAGNHDVAAVVGSILDADRALAATAIADAIIAGASAGDVATAQQELAKGDAERAAGKLEQAIDRYKKAWQRVT